jgi:hypothetical protein
MDHIPEENEPEISEEMLEEIEKGVLVEPIDETNKDLEWEYDE